MPSSQGEGRIPMHFGGWLGASSFVSLVDGENIEGNA